MFNMYNVRYDFNEMKCAFKQQFVYLINENIIDKII